MCGRFTSKTKPAELVETFKVDEISDSVSKHAASYNVAPTQDVLVVADYHGSRRLGTMRWGLVPFFMKDASGGSRMINARAEVVATKPAYRRAFAKRRCLIPADGFYEWQKVEGKKQKQPWYFTKPGEQLAFAGLWEIWHDPEQPEDAPALRTCTIITTEANEDMGDIHNRMPLVLPKSEWDAWLDAENTSPHEAESMLKPPPAHFLDKYRVTTGVNSTLNDGPELVAPQD